MKRLLLIAAGLASLAGAAHAQMGPPDMDTNHDGKVTWAEFKAGTVNRMLERLDTNHDGKISKAEYQVMVDRMAQFGGPDAKARAAQRFAEQDTNHDGYLSKAEMEVAAKRRFDAADTNHDGWLSKDELTAMRQNRRGGAGG